MFYPEVKARPLMPAAFTHKKVGFAVEFEVMSQDSDRSDLFGRAISLDGGLLLAGAPKKHRNVPEVQLIVSTGTASEVGPTTRLPVSWIALVPRIILDGQKHLDYPTTMMATTPSRVNSIGNILANGVLEVTYAVGIDDNGTIVVEQTNL